MTKINLLALLLIILIQNQGFSQIKISGQIKDKKNNPIEFVEVQLQNKDSIIFKSELTNAEGKFSILTVKEECFIIVKHLGSLFYKKNIKLENDIDLGIITIENINSIEKIIVNNKKKIIEKKIDRIVYNVENSTIAIGGDALEALSKTPNVRVNNENIGIIGKSTVSIMIDDKLIQFSGIDLMGYLKSISSSNISKIEVITNPTAKYDAEGNSGIINIVLKKAKKQNYLSGSVNSSYEQRTYALNSSGLGINYKKNKFYLSTGINTNFGKTAPKEQLKIYYPTRTLDQETNRIDYRKNISGRFTMEYDFNEKSNIGFQYLGSNSKPDIHENVTSKYLGLIKLDSITTTTAFKKSNTIYHSFDLNYNKKFGVNGTKMMLDMNYLFRNDGNIRPFESNTFNDIGELINNTTFNNRNDGLQKIKIYASKIDFEIPNELINLKFGGKISFIKNKSNNSFYNFFNNQYNLNNNFSDNFDYSENIQSIYLSLDKEVKKWEFQFGLRIENTQTKGYSLFLNQNNNNNYLNIFPTLFINFNRDEDNVYSFSYGKRIGRPSYKWLNPFRWYQNTKNYSEGNPSLTPTIVNNLELSHFYKNKLNSTIYFNFQTNGFNQLAFVNENSNALYFKPVNFFENYSFGINEHYQFNWLKYVFTTLTADISYDITTSNNTATARRKSLISTNFQFLNSIPLNKEKTILTEINLWYQAPRVTGILKESFSSSLDFGFKYLLFEKTLALSLNASDILKTSVAKLNNNINGISQEFNNYYDNRQIRFNVSYQFGNNKVKNKQLKQSNDEERNRAN